MKKEDWKDEILRSLEGIQRAEPSPEILDKIRAKTNNVATNTAIQIVRRPYIALAAACLLLLLMANIRALNQGRNIPSTSSAYQVDNANFDLYDYH